MNWTTTPATSDTLAAMFQNATIEKAEKNCATLNNSIINGSSRPLQGIEFHTLQASLTTPDDDNTPSPATISVNLPREVVERIFLLLDAESMLTCKLVNREFNEIIQSSIVLQYSLACKAVDVIDNPKSPLSYAERLEALKKRENAWRRLRPVFERTINVNRQTDPQICSTTEGVFFLRDDNRKDLKYCHLTSFHQDNPQWITIGGHGPVLDWSGILVNSVVALHEHDLIVNLISTSSDVENPTDLQRHSLDLVFLKFSTGEYHPLARHPRIYVQTSFEVEPWVVSRIVGDNLALVIHSDDGTFSDKLFIFDWKTGRKVLQHEASEDAYSGLVFISPELLLVPNCTLSQFEVWHLPPRQYNHKPPIQILSLKIPAIPHEHTLLHFGCRGKPNPFLHSVPYLPPCPFFSSPENSIITAKLQISLNSRLRASYNLIMHRRALLDTIQTWTSPLLYEQQKHLPTWLTNEVTMHQIADSENGSVELDTQSFLVSTLPLPKFSRAGDSPAFPTYHIPAESGSPSVSSGFSTNSSTSRCTFLQVPWANWGPPISRWFQVNEIQALWLTLSNGQRYAFSEPNPLDTSKLIINVADFNPHNLRRNPEMMGRPRGREGENTGSNGDNGEGKEKERFEILDHKGVFSEEVYMGLKCSVYRAPDEYDFDAVWMDEQRLFGVKLNRDGWEESIRVLYIGEN